MNALFERTMWDACGNAVKAEAYVIGPNCFELYLHDFNDSVPRRIVGDIGRINGAADLFLAVKKSEGFQEQLPSYNPHFWHA